VTFAAGDWIRSAAHVHGDAIYLSDAGSNRDLSFAEVETRVCRAGNALRDLGVQRGGRVAILATDSHRYVETIGACMRIGATFVPLNVRLAAPEVEALLRTARAEVAVVSGRYAPSVLAMAERLPDLRHVVCLDEPLERTLDYEGLLSAASSADPGVRVDDSEILGLSFTSGTTGLPKGVLQSQRMLKHTVSTCTRCWELGPGHRYYTGAPIFHIAGLAMALMGAEMGFHTTLAPSFDPAQVLGWLQRDELTALFLVPTMVAAVLDQPGVRDARYEQLRAINYGAAPMPIALLRRAMDVFECDFVQAFGAGTEAGWHTALGSADHRRAAAGAEHLLGSVGRPVPGVELRICDDEWREVPRGQVGEVVVRSDMVMSGYLDRPEETAQALHPDGWFRAGDLGRQDEHGYVYLSGRKKDMIVRGGENIYPIEIEQVLHTHPGVAEAAVVGVPDEYWGEIPRAHVVPSGPPPEVDELIAYCREHLGPHKIPTIWVFEPELLPRNAAGKILKRDLVSREPRAEVLVARAPAGDRA
jgi:acyl-CoA synthetase (AMP-forming)/AMP-acid ligase II